MKPVRHFLFYVALILSVGVMLSCNLPVGNLAPTIEVPVIDTPDIDKIGRASCRERV